MADPRDFFDVTQPVQRSWRVSLSSRVWAGGTVDLPPHLETDRIKLKKTKKIKEAEEEEALSEGKVKETGGLTIHLTDL